MKSEIFVFPRSFALCAATTSLVVTLFSATAEADTGSPPSPVSSAAPTSVPTPSKPERFSVHAQTTDVQQYHGAFPAAYDGPQSISSRADTAKTVDATIYLGARVGKGTEFYVNPELDQGFGLGNPSTVPGLPYNGTFGAAGFTSAEAYKVGRDESYARIHRAFVRQTFDFGGGDAVAIDPDINQLRGSVDPKSLIVTAGKFGVVDVFDNNPYAHDPRNDFLNWSIVDMGAFDYAADAWGYTYGASAEFAGRHSTLRAGLFQLSVTPNTIGIEHQPLRQYSPILEFEQRTSLFGAHPGAVKALVYDDVGYMGTYADAVAAAAIAHTTPATAFVRNDKHDKVGAGINVAQEVSSNVGAFLRLSAMNGSYEAYDFTDIDRSVSGGISIDGALYRRPHDTFGLAGAVNGISGPARQFFAAGGLGILVGDGDLSYGGERILETYYKVGISRNFAVTVDYQRIADPGYNTARGPISVLGLRYHANI